MSESVTSAALPSRVQEIATVLSNRAAWCTGMPKKGQVCFDHWPSEPVHWCEACLLQRASTMLRDLASALQQTQAERDAMQRRAEAAESDWQYAESALTATQKLTVHSLAKAEAAHQRLREAHASRPTIICLCGSTRFIETFAVQTWELELQGFIVLGCTLLPSWYCPVRDHFAENQGVKPQRDAHHLQKIDLADEVLVLNVGGYIGESTRNEIAYAIAHDKPVRYLEPLPASPATVASGTCSRSATR